jgi:2-keto-4-pentenoate hydratase/2-oxohepta-3-ene-1,7-dioic acid hydratase in catechol pathway
MIGSNKSTMGLVLFDAGEKKSCPGFSTGNRVVDLTEIPLDYTISSSIDQSLLSLLRRTAEIRPLLSESDGSQSYVHESESVSLRRPWLPEKIICLEGCYKHDLTDDGYDPQLIGEEFHQQDWPSTSVAPKTALRGPSEELRIPSYAEDVRPGAGVGLIVGEQAKQLDAETALESIVGYTPITSLRIYESIPNLEGYKMYDGSFAYGPSVLPLNEADIRSLDICVEINGKEIERRTTAEWRFSPGKLVAEASQIMTLESGDLITTGVPTRISNTVTDGDTVTVRIGDSHQLTNKITQDQIHVE